MTRHFIVLQHADGETAGSLGELLESRGLDVTTIRTWAGDPIPDEIGAASHLVVLGGEMGVDDIARFPHLALEVQLIRKFVDADLPVLGVCLGSQLLAHALGATVAPTGNPEIGWYPVHLAAAATDDRLFRDLPTPLEPFHWHGDAFTVPPGAISLASSERTPCQVFRFGEATYGIQFHPEITPEVLEAMLSGSAEQLASWGASEESIRRQSVDRLPALRKVSAQIFSRWIDCRS